MANSIEVQFGFGGPAGRGGAVTPGIGRQGQRAPAQVGYALVVHEDLSAAHPVGQAKYLEIPFKARMEGFFSRMATFLERAVIQRGALR